ncbi:MAG: hypothetical protein KIT80_23040 [Chitinophagaceae bacterium]|nr:hypothetical protein [Chitinophagaceae bacterium]MCW5929815.1 hypothetical protein [Chitinophagaceae bacterium]
MKKARQTYEQRAEQFAGVCDIGIKVLTEAEIAPDEKERMLRICRSDKEMALHPLPVYKRVGSLKCIEAEHFWYWNEHNGKHIDEFWRGVREAGLPYERKDMFKKILRRGSISNMQEYDYVIDEILVAEQTGRISLDEVERLNNYLNNYEKKRQK